MMKKYLYSILMLLVCSFAFGQQNELSQAESAYAKGDYQQAIQMYEQVIDQFGASSELYYNLGNAYYKDQSYAGAILNYERSLLLNPDNEDAFNNLALANTQVVDKIETIEPFFLAKWVKSASMWMSSNGWAYAGLTCFILFVCGLFLYFFLRQVVFRKIGFFGALIFIVLSIICNIFAFQQLHRVENRNYAIVFTPSVTVKGSPAESGTELFVLHEGVKVKLKGVLGDWSEIELADGNVGWLPTKDITVI